MTELLGHGDRPVGTPGNAIQRDRGQASSRRRRPGRGSSSTRSRAAALGAPEASAVIADQLPALLPHVGPAQLDRLQTVIDAAAVNPAVEAEVAALESKAWIRYGSLAVRDERIGHRADRARERLVPVGEGDRRIRLDYRRLVDAGVFPATAANPDEARFLALLRRRLEASGVWLRVNDRRITRGPGGATWERSMVPELWLSLGPDGDHIPAPRGQLTREALLETTAIGALHYRTVYQNPARVEMDRLSARLQGEIVAGATEHGAEKAKRDNPSIPYVPEIAEWIGDAEFPDPNVWSVAWVLYRTGSDLLLQNQVDAARPFLLAAAAVARSASAALAEYVDRRSSGAAVAVKWLERVETAAAIVGSVLTVGGIVRGGVMAARAAAAKEIARAAPRAPGWVVSGEIEGERIMWWRSASQGSKSGGRWVPGGERGHTSSMGPGGFF